MRIRHEGHYAIIEGDEDVIKRSGIDISKLSTKKDPRDIIPTMTKIYYLYDKAWKTKTRDAAAVYVVARQTFLNHYGKREKGAKNR